MPAFTFCSPSTTTTLAGLNPLVDHPLIPDPLADLDLPDLHLVVRVHDGRLVVALQLRHRALRNQQGFLLWFSSRRARARTVPGAARCRDWETRRRSDACRSSRPLADRRAERRPCADRPQPSLKINSSVLFARFVGIPIGFLHFLRGL